MIEPAQQAALTVSIVAPDGLPSLQAHVYAYPETREEFYAVVQAAGGLGAFWPHYSPGNLKVIASLAGGHRLFLYEPSSEPQVAAGPPFLATFSQAVSTAQGASR